jgi:hypothetical protein
MATIYNEVIYNTLYLDPWSITFPAIDDHSDVGEIGSAIF